MRIVSFGDIHMSLRSIERLGPELRAADLVILSGDLTNFCGADDAEKVLASTRQHAPAVLAVSGNLDQPVLNAGAFRDGGCVVVTSGPGGLAADLKYLG